MVMSHRLAGQSVSVAMVMGVVMVVGLMDGGCCGRRLVMVGSMVSGIGGEMMEASVVIASWRGNGTACRAMNQIHLRLATVAGQENRLWRHHLAHLRLSGMHVMRSGCSGGRCSCGSRGAERRHVDGRGSVVFEGFQHAGGIGALLRRW